MKTVTSVCTYCGTGCDIVAEIEHDTVQRITAHPQGKVSRGKLCVKGKLGFDFLYSPNRIRAARIKRSFIDKHRENFPPAIRSKLFLLREFDTEWFECDYDIGYRNKKSLERMAGFAQTTARSPSPAWAGPGPAAKTATSSRSLRESSSAPPTWTTAPGSATPPP